MRLQNKIALVTGGATGIGAATAVMYAREGAKVIIADLNEADGKATAQSIEAEWWHRPVYTDGCFSRSGRCCDGGIDRTGLWGA